MHIAFGTSPGDGTALFDAIPLRHPTWSDPDASTVSRVDPALLQAAAVPEVRSWTLP